MTRNISLAEGEAKAERGEMRRVFNESTGKLAGYQPVEAPQPISKASDTSRSALSVPEMMANAGLLGHSRTMGLTEQRKLEKLKTGLLRAEEDFVERTKNLIDAYTSSANFYDLRKKRKGLAPGGDRAVRVYPKKVKR